MKRTVSRLFNTHQEALHAVEDLEAAGFAHEDIALISGDHQRTSQARSFAPAREDSIVHTRTTVDPAPLPASEPLPNALHEHEQPDNVHASHGIGKGAAIGGVIGGGASLLAGIGLLAVPGMGPVLAAGFLASALAGAATGAATGGMMGALRDAGVDAEEAGTYVEGVRRGGAMVCVRTPEDRSTYVEEVLTRHGGLPAADRRAEYEADGWTAPGDEAGRTL